MHQLYYNVYVECSLALDHAKSLFCSVVYQGSIHNGLGHLVFLKKDCLMVLIGSVYAIKAFSSEAKVMLVKVG